VRFVVFRKDDPKTISQWRRDLCVLATWRTSYSRLLAWSDFVDAISLPWPESLYYEQHSPRWEIITRVIKRFGISAVRGSSTRGWIGGLKGMLAAYRQGYDLIVVPDGPRGPRTKAKPGILQLARATGARIFPVTYGANWKMTVNSWDRLLIPFPFSRVTYVAGQPILVPADASLELMEEKRQELENALLSITALADASFTMTPTTSQVQTALPPHPPRTSA